MAIRDHDHGRPRSLLAVLLLACVTLVVLDHREASDSPVDAARSVVGEVVGPLEEGASTALRPLASVPGFFRTNRGLREDVARLESENAALRSRLAGTALERNRAAQLDGLLAMSETAGRALLPARVVGFGAAQSFSRTVTIDAGRASGILPDMTVVNHDGLVGRVVRSDQHTATVVLVVDQESVVGARVGESLELGFLRGGGEMGGDGRLELELVDGGAALRRGDVVSTWGSRTGAPYVADVPIGVVESVHSSPRQLSKHAVVRPLVRFSALDVVAVVVGGSGREGLVSAHRKPGEGDR